MGVQETKSKRVFLKCTKSFSASSKALLFLPLHKTHMMARGEMSMQADAEHTSSEH